MPSRELIKACKEATEALTRVGVILREKDGETSGSEKMAVFILLKGFQFVMTPLRDNADDEDDENPFKYDDDHTFT